MMKINDYKNLILVAQGNDKLMAQIAKNDIIADIMETSMRSALAKYRNKTTAGNMIDYEDLQQIFLMACSEAIDIVDTEVGNPKIFIIQKGKWAVINALTSTYRQTLKQHCLECGATTRLNEKAGNPICPKCGAEGHNKVIREQFVNTDDGTVLHQVAMEGQSIEEEIEYQELIADFRMGLNGRKLEIFDMIIEKGYDRDNCKNYIKEIAEELGVGVANINLRLRDIKKALTQYLEELKMEDIRVAQTKDNSDLPKNVIRIG